MVSTPPPPETEGAIPEEASRRKRKSDAADQGEIPTDAPPRKKRGSPTTATMKATSSPVDNPVSLPDAAHRGENPHSKASSQAHFRFGSDSPPPASNKISTNLAAAPPEDEPSSKSGDEVLSDDEGPEAVALGSAKDEARAREADTARAKERFRLAKKKTQKAQTQRLQAQAANSAARQQKLKSKTKRPRSSSSDDSRLPDFLPAELLAAAPDERPITPPPADSQLPTVRQAKRSRVEALERKKPKIVKKGSVGVQALERRSKTLAPKASKEMKNIRQQWAKGGSAVRGNVHRRAIHKGSFVKA